MRFLSASAMQRGLTIQLLVNTLLSFQVLPIFLLFLVAAVFALQVATALVVVVYLFCIEMLASEPATAIVASVRSYILRMVAFLSASLAH